MVREVLLILCGVVLVQRVVVCCSGKDLRKPHNMQNEWVEIMRE